jgi:hypothetical protein
MGHLSSSLHAALTGGDCAVASRWPEMRRKDS